MTGLYRQNMGGIFSSRTNAAVKDPLKIWNLRPERSGKWFITHQDTVHSIDHQASCDIWSEFLSHHPNGSRTWSAFVLLQLTDLQLEQQRNRIRICSYRWRHVHGVGPDGTAYKIPRSCDWFLKYLQQNKLIGWVDWVANIGANVPVPETLEYMGGLYARQFVSGEWLFDLDALESSMSRGWIVQEQSFGPLDPLDPPDPRQSKWGFILLVAVGMGVGAAVVFGTRYGMIEIACQCEVDQGCCGHLCYNPIIQLCCGDHVVNVTSHC